MNTKIASLGLGLTLVLAACGGNKPNPVTPPGGDGKPNSATVDSATQNGYKAALDQFVQHDKDNNWDDAACTSTAKAFLDVNDQSKKNNGKELPQALYDAGLSNQRCNKDDDAKKLFQQALALDPKFHRAKVQLALYDYKAGGDAALESTIAKLQEAVLDAEYQNTDALVNLAMLQMKRNSSQGQQGCADDYECAKKNIQRALAIDDSFMPAFNQLGLYYLDRARAKAGRKTAKAVVSGKKEKNIDQQQLELAALVCSQGIRKNGKYAPIHNTAGLIQVELANINGAVAEFKNAMQLDPNFFEALMNYAAVNISFRGFKNAEDAYRQALKLKPNDFDANLGLALALRGQINDSNFDANVKEAQSLIDKAKQVAPDRPESYYNEGILTQEYKVKSMTDDKAKIPVYDQAKTIYQTFIDKAGSAPEFADAVKRAKERISDINDTEKFITDGIKAAEDEASKPQTDQPAGLEGDTGAGGAADSGAQQPAQLSGFADGRTKGAPRGRPSRFSGRIDATDGRRSRAVRPLEHEAQRKLLLAVGFAERGARPRRAVGVIRRSRPARRRDAARRAHDTNARPWRIQRGYHADRSPRGRAWVLERNARWASVSIEKLWSQRILPEIRDLREHAGARRVGVRRRSHAVSTLTTRFEIRYNVTVISTDLFEEVGT